MLKPHQSMMSLCDSLLAGKASDLTMTFKPIDTVILDLTVTCTACGYRIQPNEVVLVAPQSVRCPKCQQVFSASHCKVA
jgi:predicted Zn-ribbon and HTH transcriptional regulator